MFAKTLKKKKLLQATVLVAPMLLAGCSSIPDAANPVEWYRSSVDYFESDDEEVTETKINEAGEEVVVTTPKKEVASGFKAAETTQRQYAQPVMRQGDIVNPLGEARKVASNEPPAPMAAPTATVNRSDYVAATTARQSNTTQQPVARQPSIEVDRRSVGEIFAANINQKRPVNVGTQMGHSQMDAMGNFSFDTVIVSGNGITRQAQNYKPQTQVAQFSSRGGDTYSSAMLIEPSVVAQGYAQSLSRFNSTMFSGSFQVATIQFGNGSAKLTGEDLRILKEVLSIHQQQGGIVRIVGHASSRTRNMTPDAHEKINHKVSLGRADKVARELLRLGVTSERLYVGGVADSQPLYQEVMPSGEAGNRRTEIFVDY